jgi:hypothetical protein
MFDVEFRFMIVLLSNLPCLRSSSLHPPVLTRFDPKLVTLAVLFGKIVALLR